MCYPTGHHCASNYRTSAVTWLETTGHYQTGIWEKMSENSPFRKSFIAPLLFLCWSKYLLSRIRFFVFRGFYFIFCTFSLCQLLPKPHPCPKVLCSSIPRNDHKCQKVKKGGKCDFQSAVNQGWAPKLLEQVSALFAKLLKLRAWLISSYRCSWIKISC